ncbi:ParB/RepB/Spo0J family partition protein [Pseudobacteriovorax antillogorgiicola]|uniref:ParB/RepB/Spo0J family partition protein n=1 Tax=Pseudobacteriovorax antillogorgiicola TaxID=1513793 RepID=A0A1Y6BIY9_9BACT|nr:ParB N-terminal domain-containing protein [Pseudobacteriovorax antillogorgiicola]TCS56389.1 ParB/RepB/Spo0J family partition protein [Pseudobacteriovorax antillogorgiicola]SMF06222.1 ParB/RepB/Spo0J family partition protein [Pseudobacteriovorax antillogorgiicola]
MLKNLYDLDTIKSDNYRSLDEDTVDKLVRSILAIGLQEPIHLFHVNETGELFVISGHHRLEAIRRIKSDPRHAHLVFQAEVVRGSIEEYQSQCTAIKSVMANAMRKDMALLDRATAYAKLLDSGLDLETIGLMVDESPASVKKTLGINELPREVIEFIRENPKLRDSVVFKFAARFQKDPSFDMVAALQDVLNQKNVRRGAQKRSGPRVNKNRIGERLAATGQFSHDQIKTVLTCLSRELDLKS